jgi:hypothetical protein
MKGLIDELWQHVGWPELHTVQGFEMSDNYKSGFHAINP